MIFAAVAFGIVALMSLFCLALRRVAAIADEINPSPGRPMVYCERCEQQTAVAISSSTAAVVACYNPECGFRRLLRDELHPEKVGVLHDPGPGKTPPSRSRDPWNQSH